MKTTNEIIKPCIEYKQITFTEHWCKNKNEKWYSEEEIKKAISKCYSYGHAEPLTEYYDDKDDNLICIAELEEHLFAPDLNSRSSDEDSLNKDLERCGSLKNRC